MRIPKSDKKLVAFARTRLGLNSRQLAQAVGVKTDRTVRRWMSGETSVPDHVVISLKSYLAGHRPEGLPAGTDSDAWKRIREAAQ